MVPNCIIKNFIKMTIDLNTCKKGDILLSSRGAKLEYVCPTPWEHCTYLDHVVKYVENPDGTLYPDNCYGTRTSDGFVFAKNRLPDLDHDIIEIIRV